MNNVILRGRFTSDAEIKVTADEKSTTIARFTLAVPDRTRRNSNGEYETDFIKIAAFNSLADTISQYTAKGSEVLLTGRLHTYSYSKDDKKVYSSEVIAERIEFVAKCNRPDTSIPEEDAEPLPFR